MCVRVCWEARFVGGFGNLRGFGIRFVGSNRFRSGKLDVDTLSLLLQPNLSCLLDACQLELDALLLFVYFRFALALDALDLGCHLPVRHREKHVPVVDGTAGLGLGAAHQPAKKV